MDGIKMEADIHEGCWKGDTLHFTVSLYDENGNTIKMKSTSLSIDDLNSLDAGEDVDDFWVKGRRVYIPMLTKDEKVQESVTDVGIDIDELITFAEETENDDGDGQIQDDFVMDIVNKVSKNPGEKIFSYPKNDEKWETAIKNAENFNMSPPDKTNKTTLHLPGPGEPIAQIGKVAGIIYTSNKEGLGENQQYIHEMKKPYPILALAGTNKKPVYIIFGGKTYISEPGDDSGEAPGWMID
jgi:hypothetical protein